MKARHLPEHSVSVNEIFSYSHETDTFFTSALADAYWLAAWRGLTMPRDYVELEWDYNDR